MSFKAAVLEQLNAPLAIEELEIPHLGVGHVLVNVAQSGICGAQLGEIAGVKGNDKYLPHLLGHEGSGTVIRIGAGVTKVRPGDRVVLHWRKGPGIEAMPPRYESKSGRTVGGGWVTTFNQQAICSENRVTKIDDDIPFDIAALMGCAVTTALGLITREAKVEIGQSAIVFGCGGVGLNVIQALSLVSAHPIIAVDKFNEKLHLAVKFGATDTFNIQDFGVETLRQVTSNLVGSRGLDLAVDTTGVPEVVEHAFTLARKTFLVAQVRHDRKISIQTLPMHAGKTITASDGGATDPSVDIPRYLNLYRHGKLQLDRLITHRAPLLQINETLDEIRQGKVGRAVISMED